MKTLSLILMCSDCLGTEHGWHGHWFFPLFFFVFILMCILFRGWRRRNYAYGSGWSRWYGHRDFGKGDAKNILKARYARGEISKEEFERIKKDITQ